MDHDSNQEIINDTQPEKQSYRFSFQGDSGTLFGIQIVNLFLIIVTLGIYYFWAKTKVRNYIWSQVDFNGDRFAYQGTGKEILKGWLKAVLIFGVPLFIFQNVPALAGAPKSVIIAGGIASFLLFMIFIPVATVGSRRYRLSRTSLRGIRFSFRGKWQEYVKILLKSLPWMILTFGFYTPYFVMRCHNFFIEKSYFGNQKFSFNGEGRDLSKSYIIASLLAFPTLMISLIWYVYKQEKYIWNHIQFGASSFRSNITFGGFISLYLVNGLILIFSLGLGTPWVKVRTMNYYLKNLTLEGQVDLGEISQDAEEASAFGEEIGDFFSFDFDLA